MKDIIKYIVNTYGTQKIHYCVIVYGNTATTRINFGQTPPTREQLKQAVENLPLTTGQPDLREALKQARNVFKAESSRPSSRKFLVIMADKKSGASEGDVKELAGSLKGVNIHVIAVAVGAKADPQELENTTPNKENVITANKDQRPENVGEKIMEKVRGNRANT